MTPVTRRPAATVAPPPPAPAGVNFGDLDFYTGGFTLPQGQYAVEWMVQMFSGFSERGKTLQPRLGVMGTFYPLDGGEAKQQFFSMGGGAEKSFAPDPETGKGLVPIPGAPASSANNLTNWALMLKSLYDTGLPKGIFTNDLTTIDGIWVQTENVPEPEERKSFGARSATGEAALNPQAQQEVRQNQLTVMVTEILEGGKPWEGGGGFPEPGVPIGPAAEEAAPAPVAPKAGPRGVARPAAVATPVAAPAARPAARPVARAAVVAAPPPTEEPITEDDVTTAAVNGIAEVLTKAPAGTSKLLLRTGTFSHVTKTLGAEMAQAVMDTVFENDGVLSSLLGSLGYGIVGTNVKKS